MIKINLALQKSAQSSVTKGTATGFDIKNLSKGLLNSSLIQDFPVRKVVLPIVVAVLATYTLDSYKESELGKLDKEIEAINLEKPKIQAEVNKLKSYEALKSVLEADEIAIKTKIETIQKLLAGRNSSPKMLLDVSTIIPKDVWLSDFEVRNGEVTLLGNSIDLSNISDFMKNLGENVYFSDLVLKNTQQAKDESGLEVANFELRAKRAK